MSGNKLDRRIRKTLQLLQDALMMLISEKGYEDITVQDILDRANVGRSTFYAHFENKDQLLNSILLHLNDVFEERNRQLAAGELPVKDSQPVYLPFRLLQFVEQNHDFFKALLGKQGQVGFSKPLYDYLFAQAYQHLELLLPQGKGDKLRLEMVTHYYVSAFIGVLVWWLEKNRPYSVEEIGQLLRKLTLPGLKEVLGTP